MEKNTIFYFTGTGNSLFAARKIAEQLSGCNLVSMTKPYQLTGQENRIGFAYPVYYRGVPLIVKKFVEALDLSAAQNSYLFAAATCGGSPGSGLSELNALLLAKGRGLDYGTILNMGGNYILMYGKPDKTDAKNAQVSHELPGIAAAIRDKTKRSCGKLSPISALFAERFRKSVHMTAQKYDVSDACISCGLCVKVCSVGNIELKDGKPTFSDHCEQCMACLQWCPRRAINYKNKTQTRERYHHPDICYQDIAS